MVGEFLQRGWAHCPAEPSVARWVAAVAPVARARVSDPAERAQWLHCEGTWFVGVDSLPNDASGDVGGAGPLAGAAYAAACALYGDLALHKGQVSVIYPGYPRPRQGESAGAFRYRRDRDAAHVDGLLPEGPERRRMLKERHAYILGLPLSATGPGASPLVVWEGSHEIMRRAFGRALRDLPETRWADVDLTDIYHAARREVFETCPRVILPAAPGEATLVHRMALHGVAAWQEGAEAPDEGRMIVYFRPEWPAGTRDWLEAP